MLLLIKALKELRALKKKEVWLLHSSVLVAIISSKWLLNAELHISMWILSTLYLCFLLYYSNRARKDRSFLQRYLFVIYALLVQSLIFAVIDVSERGFQSLELLAAVNCIFAVFILRKGVGSREET
jgi:hypothetical protein